MIFAARNSGDALDFFIFLLMTLVAVCIALVLHEVAHGLVAKWNGDYTAKYEGRLTLNPLKHIDPIGFLMMMLVGFGYAKPVPVNPYNYKHRKRGMITVAIAGVVTNLILAFVSTLFGSLMILAYNRAVFGFASEGVINFCWYMINFFNILTTINLALLFFNILPIFPLDGYRLVESFTHRGNRFCVFMRTNGQYILYGLVGLSFIVSMAFNYVGTLPSWFGYIDILGTYLDFFVNKLAWVFQEFWWLMIPII
ncbi:MAG: site-2 protease family protein [Clostridiales bacterium]|nr:site-2 protease family protein [Clostridiales bacterium]